jgi:putative transcriptional regulator
MSKAFDMITAGLDDVETYFAGNGGGFVAHIPDEVDVKAIRNRLNLSQPKFAATFGFSVGRIRDWEQKRFPVDAPSRIFLTVIEREPAAVMRALAAQPAGKREAGARRATKSGALTVSKVASKPSRSARSGKAVAARSASPGRAGRA